MTVHWYVNSANSYYSTALKIAPSLLVLQVFILSVLTASEMLSGTSTVYIFTGSIKIKKEVTLECEAK